MKNGLIDTRVLFASSPLARFTLASVEFVPIAAAMVRLLQAQTFVLEIRRPPTIPADSHPTP
jgi:hypothetical protein